MALKTTKSIKPIIIAIIALAAAVASYYGINIPPEIQEPAANAVCAIASGC